MLFVVSNAASLPLAFANTATISFKSLVEVVSSNAITTASSSYLKLIPLATAFAFIVAAIPLVATLIVSKYASCAISYPAFFNELARSHAFLCTDAAIDFTPSDP